MKTEITGHFDLAFNKTMEIEGKNQLTNDRLDPGGQTYSGISRVYWPEWEGWPIIDTWLADKSKPFPIEVLEPMVRKFFRINFWNRIQGDRLAELAPLVAYELFDSAVNVDVTRAVTWLQHGFNVARGEYGEDLVVDGRLGPKTISALNIYLASKPGSHDLNEEILVNCMNGEQYIFYRANPRHKYFRGWFRRV